MQQIFKISFLKAENTLTVSKYNKEFQLGEIIVVCSQKLMKRTNTVCWKKYRTCKYQCTCT